jgi:septal ring factor EnvC (AmiA/AmiB activator)
MDSEAFPTLRPIKPDKPPPKSCPINPAKNAQRLALNAIDGIAEQVAEAKDAIEDQLHGHGCTLTSIDSTLVDISNELAEVTKQQKKQASDLKSLSTDVMQLQATAPKPLTNQLAADDDDRLAAIERRLQQLESRLGSLPPPSPARPRIASSTLSPPSDGGRRQSPKLDPCESEMDCDSEWHAFVDSF